MPPLPLAGLAPQAVAGADPIQAPVSPAAGSCAGAAPTPTPGGRTRRRLTAGVGVEDAEFEARGVGDEFALGWHPAGQGEDQAADGVDVGGAFLVGQHLAEFRLEGFDRHAGVEFDRPVRPFGHLGRGVLVVLVGDVADDGLDQVLDRDQAVDAAVFVDHQRHVGALLAHLQQQVEHRDRRHHEQRLAFDRLQAEGPGLADRGEDILDVHHAGDVIEAFAVDRVAGVPVRWISAIAWSSEAFGHGHDVGARHHDVVGGAIAQLQDVG